MTVVAGLDLSLTSTGIAVIPADKYTADTRLLRVESKPPDNGRDPKTGKKLKPTLKQRMDRLDDIEQRVLDVIRNAGAELVVIESPSFGSVGSATRDLAGLWWRVVGRIDILGIPVAEVSPSGRIKYALGTGRGDKDRVLAAVIRRYPEFQVTGNDVADALVLAAMGTRRLGHPIEKSLPAANIAAMNGAHWPEMSRT